MDSLKNKKYMEVHEECIKMQKKSRPNLLG